MALRGSFRVLIMCDVADSILLDRLGPIVGVAPERSPSFAHPTPDYVRFERPPLVEALAPLEIEPHLRVEGKVKYFDYGVVSVELVRRSNWTGRRWWKSPAAGLGARRRAVRPERDPRARGARGARAGEALPESAFRGLLHCAYTRGARSQWSRHGGRTPGPAWRRHRPHVRGETCGLSDSERQEVLQASISYYPTDLLVPGWTAALIYDTVEAPHPPFNCWSTPTPSCWNSATTMRC